MSFSPLLLVQFPGAPSVLGGAALLPPWPSDLLQQGEQAPGLHGLGMGSERHAGHKRTGYRDQPAAQATCRSCGALCGSRLLCTSTEELCIPVRSLLWSTGLDIKACPFVRDSYILFSVASTCRVCRISLYVLPCC